MLTIIAGISLRKEFSARASQCEGGVCPSRVLCASARLDWCWPNEEVRWCHTVCLIVSCDDQGCCRPRCLRLIKGRRLGMPLGAFTITTKAFWAFGTYALLWFSFRARFVGRKTLSFREFLAAKCAEGKSTKRAVIRDFWRIGLLSDYSGQDGPLSPGDTCWASD